SAHVRLLNSVTSRFDDVTLNPVQPEGSDAFVHDKAWYGAGGVRVEASVTLGTAGILRDVRVVPITFQPVTYNPAKGELAIASRMEIEIEFGPAERSVEEPVARNYIPVSFDRMYRDMVINYRTPDDTQVGPGTYLMCSSSSIGVTARVEALLDWRRRQGYNVVVETFSSSATRYQIKEAIQNRYDTVDPPLEHIVIVGDVGGPYAMPCWSEGLSGFHGEGVHY
ncbi:MAG: hypothetical protein GY704_16015, partial [Phycisphaeraceae bacterium]|nr:hypothetical protein [Phycisphaeraceae bacterium]